MPSEKSNRLLWLTVEAVLGLLLTLVLVLLVDLRGGVVALTERVGELERNASAAEAAYEAETAAKRRELDQLVTTVRRVEEKLDEVRMSRRP